jgi:Ca-activated chloride channel family protein
MAASWPLLAPLALGFALVNPASKPVRDGNRAYEAGDYEKALALYRSAAESAQDDAVPHFDAGGALYRQKRYKEAVEEYERALGSGPGMDAAAHYNIGNCQFRVGRLDQAVASYRRALELKPDDEAAKCNLELAMQLLKQSQSEKPSQKQGKQGQKRGEQQKGAQAGQKGQQASAQQRQAQGERTKAQQQAREASARPAQAVPMTREEAIKLLEALSAQDRRIQRRIVRVPEGTARLPTPDKDW